MEKILFLDLEDTIINVFSPDATLTNLARVQAFVAREKPDKIRIFSFAISDGKDVALFFNNMKGWLEKSFGFRIDETPDSMFTTRRFFEMFVWKGTFFEDELEAMVMHGKSLGFLQWIRLSEERLENAEIILLDDAHAEEMDISLPARGLRLRLVDVARI